MSESRIWEDVKTKDKYNLYELRNSPLQNILYKILCIIRNDRFINMYIYTYIISKGHNTMIKGGECLTLLIITGTRMYVPSKKAAGSHRPQF